MEFVCDKEQKLERLDTNCVRGGLINGKNEANQSEKVRKGLRSEGMYERIRSTAGAGTEPHGTATIVGSLSDIAYKKWDYKFMTNAT